MEENYTARFRADISDLKANITTANLKMKEINAQFKAAASAAELAGDAQGKLAAEMDKLDEVIKVLQSKLKNYQTQLQKTEDYVANLRKEEAHLQEELEKSKKAYGDSDEKTKAYADQLKKCQTSIKGAEKEMSRLRTTIDNTKAEINGAKTSLKNLGDGAKTAGERVQNLSTNLTAVNTAVSGLYTAVDGLTDRLINLAFNGLKVAGDAMKEIITSSFEVGSAFEKSLSTAQATMMADDADMEPLKALAQELGATTVKSAKDVADSYNYMAQAGWKTEEMLAATADMINLSIASGEDMAMVTDIVTDALTAFGMEASDASRLCDVLAAAAAASNTNVEMMGESFKYAAPLAGAMGYSAEDTALALGLMANAGIKASQAGTSMRKIFSQTLANVDGIDLGTVHIDTVNADGSMRDLKTVLDELRVAMNGLSEAERDALSGDLRVAAQELNVALEDENGTLKSTAQLAADVAEAMDGLSASEQIAFSDAASGKTAMAGLLAILNASDDSYTNLTDAIYNSAGACEEMAAIAGDNLAGSMKGLESRIESVQIALYDKLEKPVRSVVDTVAGKFGELANSMTGGELAPSLGVISDALSRLAEKVGPIIDEHMPELVGLFDTFAESTAGVIDALPGLIEETLPKLIDQLGKMMEGAPDFVENTLPKVVDGIGWLIENGDTLIVTLLGLKGALAGLQGLTSIVSVINTITTLFGSGGALAGAGTALSGIGTAVSGAFSSIGTVLSTIGTAIVGVLGWPATIAIGIAAAVGGLFALLYNKCEGFRNWANGVGESIKNFFIGAVDDVKAFFADFSLDKVKEAFSDATTSVGDFFTKLGSGAKEKMADASEKINTKVSEIKEDFNSAKETVGGLIDEIKGITLEDVAYKAGEVAGTVANGIVNADESIEAFFNALPEDVKLKLEQVIKNAVNWGNNLRTEMETKASELITGVTNYFGELPGKISAKIALAKENIITGFNEWKESAAQKINEVKEAITSGLTDLPAKMKQAAKDAVNGFINGISEKWNAVWNWGSNLASNFMSGFTAKFEINSPSRAMKRLAGFVPEGAAEGVEEKTSTAVKAMRTMADKMLGVFDLSALGEKIQFVKGAVLTSANTYSNGVNQSVVTNNNRTETHTGPESVTYAPTFNYNKPLNAKETYRQNKNMLDAILGVT